VGELVDVDHFVQLNDKAGVPGKTDEAGEQLELIVDVRVLDDRPHTEGGAGVGPRCEFASQPADGA